MIRLALFQPDIPQNAGTMLRLAGCLGIPAEIIEPCGFVFSDKHLRRAGMDYLSQVELTRHVSWETFQESRLSDGARLILLTTGGDTLYTDFSFREGDILMVGRESAGAPEQVHEAAAARLLVPMRAQSRSLNVAAAAAMVVGEALRQTGGFPVIP